MSNNALLAMAYALMSAGSGGRPVAVEEPPAGDRVCSFRLPICVHGATTLQQLSALERAWDAGRVLGVPLPPRFDVWVRAEGSRALVTDRDALALRDRAVVAGFVDGREDGCEGDFDAARVLYEASALAASPAIDEGSLRAEATALARLAVPCAVVDTAAFQRNPDRALVDAHVAPGYEEGASLFFTWLDGAFGKEPGRLITGTWALAETKTAVDAFVWNAEPDVFDVVRETSKDAMFEGSTLDDLLVELAVVRATSAEVPARLDWDVPWPAAARTLASPEGIAPTGAAYVRVDTKGHAAGARFRIDATWEQHARLRWLVVKLDAAGREMGRVLATTPPKATEAHLEVVDVDDAKALLVIAANAGDWTTAFDPDDDVWEPHGWLLTIAAE